jgi:NAD-dependent deacetylase sirtuin 2
MSVASGIPDFRSVGGLYDTLQPDVLTASPADKEAIRADPTLALEQGLFLRNPLPLLEVIRPFILGTQKEEWKATIAHRFVELLHQKTGKLTRLYTQNIDGLEGQCHLLPRDKVVAVHGSFDRAECALCEAISNFDDFCKLVQENIKDITGQDETAPRSSTPILCHACGQAAVKPSVVLFRSSLPQEFFDRVPQDISKVDLLIVIGTSLAVAPANTLVFRIPPTALRVVVNDEPVGWRLGIEYGSNAKRDYFAQGQCDAVMLDLIERLGWMGDLAPLVDHLPELSAKLVRDRSSFNESDSMNDE